MADSVIRVNVFVASPGDVSLEREQLSKVVNEINLTISALAPEKRVVLELIKWETHVHPGLGRDAQDVINQQIGDYDIFMGMMWKRFGTPTAVAESGTEEEFQRAYTSWEQNKHLPVLFYFCQAPFAPPRSREEIEQLGKVLRFRNELSDKGLVWEYEDPTSFADVIRPHLILVLSRMFSNKQSLVDAAAETSRLATESDVPAMRKQVMALAREYEHLRETMPSGNARTGMMSLVESRMRSIALSAFPLLAELVHSASPGERLAAVAILKEIPSPDYLTWLANRVGVEKPFIGYQATVALATAARTLEKSHRSEVGDAISMAKDIMSNLTFKDPNQVRTLDSAQKEIDRYQ